MIYFEARDQPLIGQLAVGQVAMNRVKDDRYPNNMCDVITQGKIDDPPEAPVMRFKCQFSFYCDGLSDAIKDEAAFRIAAKLAAGVIRQDWIDPTEGSTHYHSVDVNPSWAKTMTREVRIENHIFYRWERTDKMKVKKQGFQPVSAKLGGLKSQTLSRGWPDHIKDDEKREEHFEQVMKGQRFDGLNEVRFKKPPTELLSWNALKKFKRT
tara:strand:+ start:519 stop:1148 length:630 start_codon:yes stop_codon:yes gene_type:complete